jgi:hypothetical protein
MVDKVPFLQRNPQEVTMLRVFSANTSDALNE